MSDVWNPIKVKKKRCLSSAFLYSLSSDPTWSASKAGCMKSIYLTLSWLPFTMTLSHDDQLVFSLTWLHGRRYWLFKDPSASCLTVRESADPEILTGSPVSTHPSSVLISIIVFFVGIYKMAILLAWSPIDCLHLDMFILRLAHDWQSSIQIAYFRGEFGQERMKMNLTSQEQVPTC